MGLSLQWLMSKAFEVEMDMEQVLWMSMELVLWEDQGKQGMLLQLEGKCRQQEWHWQVVFQAAVGNQLPKVKLLEPLLLIAVLVSSCPCVNQLASR